MALLQDLLGDQAQEYLDAAQKSFAGVAAPTQQALTLPELQQYVNAGLMTPAQAQAALQSSNAYDTANVNPDTREAEINALNQMQDVSDSGGMTGEMKAQLSAALNAANTNTQGERGSIQDAMAQRGVSNSLTSLASQNAAAGQYAQTANLAATQAAGNAEQNALTAMANSGTLAGNIHNQDYTEQSNKAAAQNAINQWNAQNTTQNNQFNAGNQQQANAYNTQNAQNVSTENTGLANQRTQYNAQTPQTAFEDQIQKAGGSAGVSENQASTSTAQGEQTAGLYGGILGAISSLAGSDNKNNNTTGKAYGGEITMKQGGPVPGQAQVPGDSLRNDTVPARLSPGEVVIPRSQAQNPDLAKQFVQHLLRQKQAVKPVHPHDIRSVLDALSSRREQTA